VCNEIVLMLIGCILTVIFGRLFQHFLWRVQYKKTYLNKKIEQQLVCFELVSTLMDKRIYRLRQLYNAVFKTSVYTDDEVKKIRSEYNQTVDEWNFNINKVLAYLELNFSKELREEIDGGIGAKFRELGKACENRGREDNSPSKERDIELLIEALAGRIYNFNIKMMAEVNLAQNALTK